MSVLDQNPSNRSWKTEADLSMTLASQVSIVLTKETKVENKQRGICNLKIFCVARGKRQLTELEKIFTYHILDKRRIPKMHKLFTNSILQLYQNVGWGTQQTIPQKAHKQKQRQRQPPGMHLSWRIIRQTEIKITMRCHLSPLRKIYT